MLLELVRQARRRRTLWALLAMAAVPLIVVVALLVNGGDDSGGGFIGLARASGLNTALFVLVATSQFLLVIVVALFAGDSVASEAQWGSLRYLLVRPLGRERLLRVKLVVSAVYAVAATLVVVLVALGAGTLAFGWAGLVSPVGGGLPPGQGALRLVLAVLYVLATMAVVVGIAFCLSTLTDAPLAAVGGAVVVVVLSEVLDSVTALGGLRVVLPTHYWFAWTDLLATPVATGQVSLGLISVVPWTLGPVAVAFWHFRRKDVLS